MSMKSSSDIESFDMGSFKRGMNRHLAGGQGGGGQDSDDSLQQVPSRLNSNFHLSSEWGTVICLISIIKIFLLLELEQWV